MNKERFKSVFLILLVVINLILSEKILVNEKLWLSGYNFFVNLRNTQKKDIISVTERLSMPENIIVNTGYQSSRYIYRRNSDYFNSIYEASNKILKAAFSSSGKNISEISDNDWHSILTTKSIYLNYHCDYSSSVFAALLGAPETEFSFSSFSNIVINEEGNVFINADGKFYRIPIKSQEVTPIIQKVLEENSDKDSVINYSFDLNFDKPFGEQKTVLSPMILIYSEPLEAHIFTPVNPVVSDNEIDDKRLSDTLYCLKVNQSSARRYTEADGSLVYVENNGVLKISPNGILSFTANENGIKLNGSGSDENKLAAFITSINSALNINSDILLTSLVTENDSTKLNFDYMLDGYPVKYNNQNAISATVKNGYLTSYTQILRQYMPETDLTYSSDFIDALDNIISSYQNSLSEVRINKMMPAFSDSLSNLPLSINWYVEVDNIVAE